MKTQRLLLIVFILSTCFAQAQRIDKALNALHPSKDVKPIQLTQIDSNLLAVVYVADSFNYITKLDKTGKVKSSTRLAKVSDYFICYINFNKNGYDVFYQSPKLVWPSRALFRVNEKDGTNKWYELSKQDSIFPERYFAFGSSTFVWFNHYRNNKVELVVGKLNDTGNATLKVYPLQSHYTELISLSRDTPNQFLAYFNTNRYILTIHDKLDIDTVNIDKEYDRVISFNNQLLHTIHYVSNQWRYTALLNSSNDTLYNKFIFSELTEMDFLRPIGNKLCIATSRGYLGEYDSLAITLLDTAFQEVFTRYLDGFRITDIDGDARANEIFVLGYDSLGLVVLKVNANTVNSGIDQVSNKTILITYPNPVVNQLFIHISPSEYQYEIYDANGMLHQAGQLTNYIDVSVLKAGMYFLWLRDGQKNQTYRTKFIKL